MSYQEQCFIDCIIFAIYVLKKCWAFIVATLLISYAGAKALEKHFDI